MNELSALSLWKDRDFLKELDNVINKFYWVKIDVLDDNELPMKSIEGRVQPGSTINIDGSSSVRRTCNISFVADEDENDLTNIDNLFSIKRKIRIYEGIKNSINKNYDDIIWFKLGIFVIVQPSISHSASGCIINLSCKDKMCLLNGECAGGLPTSITFHEYDQIIGSRELTQEPKYLSYNELNNYTVYIYNNTYWTWDPVKSFTEIDYRTANDLIGSRTQVPQRFYDIIQTLVCNYGGEALSKIFINDVPLELKQIVRYTGNNILYYNTATGMYTTDESYLTTENTWRQFKFNEDVGYMYTDFIYPGSLVSSIGDNICSVLDKIKDTLGNYEYFYDVEGNFIFQEIKNYLNTSYDPTNMYRLDNNGRRVEVATNQTHRIQSNGLSIIDLSNYKVDFYSNNKSVYTFSEGSGLITSYTNNPNFNNIKNDYHIWGENEDGYAIHYHLVIKDKPSFMNTYKVIYLTNDAGEYTGGLRLADITEEGEEYTPEDWRAELYLQGLTLQKQQQRPDVYQQELLDLFDSIYNFKEKKFKADIVNSPNDLSYFFDYLNPSEAIYNCSVDVLNTKIYSYQQNKIKRLYNTDVPNQIMILDRTSGADEKYREYVIERCEREGQPFSNISRNIYNNIAIGTIGYTAQEVARDLLYQYTNYNESITIQSVPIYYLDVNTRITVRDKKSGINGDYIIKSISLPLDAGSPMSISAVRALERI